jgi:hypothetical protein
MIDTNSNQNNTVAIHQWQQLHHAAHYS